MPPGGDLGSEKHVVAGVDPDGDDVREFSACSDELRLAVAWLKKCGVTTVAMESTGVYWIPFYDLLEQRLFGRRSPGKNLPGRKTDLGDAQWIQQLHTYGLLSRTFRADLEARPVRERGRQVQQMQKALDQMIKLHKFISDLISASDFLQLGCRSSAAFADSRPPATGWAKGVFEGNSHNCSTYPIPTANPRRLFGSPC